MVTPDPGATLLPPRDSAWRLWPVALLLAVAALLAYGNTFSAPFIFDDIPALARTPSSAGELRTPADWRGSGAAGRPIVAWSLALNRVISGDAVWSYHAFNLLVHLAAGLTLFGVVREVYAAAGRTTDAIARYEVAARLQPGAAETHYRLGNAWLKLQRAEDAARCYREAIRLDPSRFEAHVNLGGCLLVLGRPAEAIPVYEAALRLRPGDPVATANLARARAAAR